MFLWERLWLFGVFSWDKRVDDQNYDKKKIKLIWVFTSFKVRLLSIYVYYFIFMNLTLIDKHGTKK